MAACCFFLTLWSHGTIILRPRLTFATGSCTIISQFMIVDLNTKKMFPPMSLDFLCMLLLFHQETFLVPS